MFRRKRRKQRGVWLPNIGTPDWLDGSPVGIQPSHIDQFVSVTLGGGRTPTLELALFEDGQSQEDYGVNAPFGVETRGLNNLIEWGYRLRRIVGNLVVSVATPVNDQQNVPRAFAGLIVTAGIIVRKEQALGAGFSMASAAGDINTASYETVRDPWIWRRAWPVLNSALGLVAGSDPVGATQDGDLVLSQSIYGSFDAGDIRTGPHVDSKVARVVGPGERIYLDVSFRIRGHDEGTPTDWDVNIFFDYRGFATLRPNQGNKRNAAR